MKFLQQLQQGINFKIAHKWNGELIAEHASIKFQMKWHFQRQMGRPHKRVIRVNVQAPLFDDPEPSENISGICPGVLYDFE